MPTFVRILIIVAVCIAVLVGVVAGIGIYWWSHHGRQLMEASKAAITEGKALGQTVDQAGCLAEAQTRFHGTKDLAGVVANNVFLKSCLDAARPTPGFCDGVPKPNEIVASVGWQAARCPSPADAAAGCRQLYAEVQQFCGAPKGAPATGPASAPPGAPPQQSSGTAPR